MATKQKSSIPYNYSENVNNCVEIPVRLTQVNNADEFPLLHAKDLEWDFILDNIQSIDYKYIEDYIYKGVSIKDNPNAIAFEQMLNINVNEKLGFDLSAADSDSI
jgi:hypothetical protein